MGAPKKYHSEEDRKEAKRISRNKTAEKSRRAAGAKPMMVYATDEERKAADLESKRKYRRENSKRINETERQRRAARTPEQKEAEKKYRHDYQAENIEARRIVGRRCYEKNKELWILGNIRNRARAAGLPFDLTLADIIPPKFCPVLGIPIERNDTHAPGSRGGPAFNSPAVDRIIPELGYVRSNIIVVSHLANCIKQNATPDQIRRVADFYDRLRHERGMIELRQIERELNDR